MAFSDILVSVFILFFIFLIIWAKRENKRMIEVLGEIRDLVAKGMVVKDE